MENKKQNNQEEEHELGIYKVSYLHGNKNKRTGKYPSAFVRVTATNPKEALSKAKKMGISGNHRLVKWLFPNFETKA